MRLSGLDDEGDSPASLSKSSWNKKAGRLSCRSGHDNITVLRVKYHFSLNITKILMVETRFQDFKECALISSSAYSRLCEWAGQLAVAPPSCLVEEAHLLCCYMAARPRGVQRRDI